MKDIIFGAVLFALTGLMFFAVISEWGTLPTLIIGVAFLVAAACWLLWGGRHQRR